MKAAVIIVAVCVQLLLGLKGAGATPGEAQPVLPRSGHLAVPLQSGPDQAAVAAGEDLLDIYGPVPITDPSASLVPFLLVLLAAACCAALYFYLKRRKTPVLPPPAPWETALAELDEARRLLKPETARDYMERAAQILRCYIESRFAISSTRQTTSEFLNSRRLAGDGELQNYRDELQRCLEQADLAKFAHSIPDRARLGAMEEAVSGFITATRPASHGTSTKTAKATRGGGA
ncbi:hypothetical protein [Desulforhopalus singaporensis]|uniref:DUF4381 domain-containing protein n=1 Tax=Desulforhopalus singaporensis TaxID=91360 RepID=A0A1H0S6H0_9BACT|nr:hypothetical protein [Desulforhopalus singaporensis]SDP37431.1 hypothetical protein SAMN05660330_02564 [Desulforhopalus singaporensis]